MSDVGEGDELFDDAIATPKSRTTVSRRTIMRTAIPNTRIQALVTYNLPVVPGARGFIARRAQKPHQLQALGDLINAYLLRAAKSG